MVLSTAGKSGTKTGVYHNRFLLEIQQHGMSHDVTVAEGLDETGEYLSGLNLVREGF